MRTDMTMMQSDLQDRVRDALFWLTGHIDDEGIAGLCFGLGLVATDHIFSVLGRFS